jgi:hypothetical protein
MLHVSLIFSTRLPNGSSDKSTKQWGAYVVRFEHEYLLPPFPDGFAQASRSMLPPLSVDISVMLDALLPPFLDSMVASKFGIQVYMFLHSLTLPE